MARFSYCVVPVGKVPSTGSALTGSWSPSPAIMIAVTRWTKSGAPSGMSVGTGVPVPSEPSGTCDRRSRDRSMAA